MTSIELALVVLAYLLGAIPFGLIFSRWLAKRDPRKVGSGNIGATNAMRAGGKRVGLLTLLADIGKGSVAVALALSLHSTHAWFVPVVALAAFIGHIFPVYLRFRGGKGVATMFGVLLPWQPWLAVIAFVFWLLVLKLARYVSLASIIAGWSLPLAAWGLGLSRLEVLACLVFAVLMTQRHHANIRRLRAGTEPRVGERAAAEGKA
ncbi:MAG: glycerol-3-phosphate 1-O-acyltransferase [Zetaproteobacteria bacterium]|nr:MAG: glycerol-3-phosphate 1-O-acyltransferase [Zetaproteobacteria bacterium]